MLARENFPKPTNTPRHREHSAEDAYGQARDKTGEQ
jgi:hypothetical protein